VAIFIGVLTGILAAILGWVGAQSLLSPRIGWSEGISKLPHPSSPCGWNYRVKVMNIGWFRAVVDLRLQAYVVVQGLDPSRKATWLWIPLPLSMNGASSLFPGADRLAALQLDVLPTHITRRLTDYGFDSVASDPSRTLEGLLTLNSTAYLFVSALGNDGWTGSLHYRRSVRYTVNDIREVTFDSSGDDYYGRLVRGWHSWWRRRRQRTVLRRHHTSIKRHRALRFKESRQARP
jgi:hypothetical protein